MLVLHNSLKYDPKYKPEPYDLLSMSGSRYLVTSSHIIGYLAIDTFWLTELGEYSLSLWGSAGEVRAKQRHASAATVALNIASSVINK